MNTQEQKFQEKVIADWAKKHPRTRQDRIQDAWMFIAGFAVLGFLLYWMAMNIKAIGGM